MALPGRPGDEAGEGDGLAESEDVPRVACHHQGAPVGRGDSHHMGVGQILASRPHTMEDRPHVTGQGEIGGHHLDRRALAGGRDMTGQGGLDGSGPGHATAHLSADHRGDQHVAPAVRPR